jgi:hypothetical protein
MKRLLGVAFVLIAGVVVLRAADETKPRAPEEKIRAIRQAAVLHYVEQETESSSRQQLLERLKANVELMTDQEVEEALATTDREIVLRKAKGKLDAAASLLREVAKEFEGTPSAVIAREMLAVHQRKPVPNYGDAPTYGPLTPAEPVPDETYVPSRSSK